VRSSAARQSRRWDGSVRVLFPAHSQSLGLPGQRGFWCRTRKRRHRHPDGARRLQEFNDGLASHVYQGSIICRQALSRKGGGSGCESSYSHVDTFEAVTSSAGRMPPSPLLSARRRTRTYLAVTTTASAQRIKDSTPSTISRLGLTPPQPQQPHGTHREGWCRYRRKPPRCCQV
jgi:hypothetical protein